MNYGKLTAGTTKTAIDTAKPSEKGEIITYLSRMGDVLEPVLDACKIVVHAVRVRGVKVIVDGNETDAILRKGEVGVQSGQRRVSAKSGKIFAENSGNLTRLHFRQHTLKAGAVIIRTAVTVIYKEYRIGEMMLFGVLQENGFLRRDLSRVFFS